VKRLCTVQVITALEYRMHGNKIRANPWGGTACDTVKEVLGSHSQMKHMEFEWGLEKNVRREEMEMQLRAVTPLQNIKTDGWRKGLTSMKHVSYAGLEPMIQRPTVCRVIWLEIQWVKAPDTYVRSRTYGHGTIWRLLLLKSITTLKGKNIQNTMFSHNLQWRDCIFLTSAAIMRAEMGGMFRLGWIIGLHNQGHAGAFLVISSTWCSLHSARPSLLPNIFCGLFRTPCWDNFDFPSGCIDRLCGLVVRVLGYRSGGPASIPGTTIKKSSGSETGSTETLEYNWGATW
jgi:hypothetical protein